MYSPDLDEEQVAWGFLLAPSSLRFSRTAEYGDLSSFAARVKDRQYSQTTGATLTIPNLAFNTWYYRKSLGPLIDGINLLLEAALDEDKFSPPILAFVMGKRRFAPCVLTEVSWDESAWLGGEPASISMNLTLAEVPSPGLKRDAKAREPEDTVPGKEGEPRNKLTDRQRKDASDAAKAYLTENKEKYPKTISDKIRANAYFLETNEETGVVEMLDSAKKIIGVVGKYDGEKFTPSEELQE
ncbi:MAG TPA: hypothetical protein V6D27_00790 [Vampirovibrionales bacterium]